MLTAFGCGGTTWSFWCPLEKLFQTQHILPPFLLSSPIGSLVKGGKMCLVCKQIFQSAPNATSFPPNQRRAHLNPPQFLFQLPNTDSKAIGIFHIRRIQMFDLTLYKNTSPFLNRDAAHTSH